MSPPHHLCPHSGDSWRHFFSSDNCVNYCVVVLKCLALSTTLILANWTELNWTHIQHMVLASDGKWQAWQLGVHWIQIRIWLDIQWILCIGYGSGSSQIQNHWIRIRLDPKKDPTGSMHFTEMFPSVILNISLWRSTFYCQCNSHYEHQKMC